MYEIGKIYIWQNQTGQDAYLNGTECIVTGAMRHYESARDGRTGIGQPTDTTASRADWVVMAQPGDLRPKRPPPGERSILALFREMEPA